MDKQKRQEQIERFLHGDLSREERKAFAQAMEQDPELAEEVALQRLIREELSDHPKQAFLNELNTLSDEFFGPAEGSPEPETAQEKPGRRSWKYGLGALIILLLGFLAWQYFQPAPPPATEQSIPAPPVSEPAPSPENAPASPTPPEKSEAPEPKAPPAEAEPAPVQPIAEADPANFTPHPYLHDLIDRQVRSGEWTIDLKAELSPQGLLSVEGQITSQEPLQDQEFLLFVYSNKGEDYLNGDYLIRDAVELQKAQDEPGPAEEGESRYAFSWQKTVDWTPGWYYYFLARARDEEPLVVGRVVKEAE